MTVIDSFLLRDDGTRLAYTATGAPGAPLIVCIPGMGELRGGFARLAGILAGGGHRVASMDLRGHGDSDRARSGYSDEETARDALALIRELGGPALVIGNSMGAAAAVLAADAEPTSVTGIVLLGPFVRERTGAAAAMTAALLAIALLPPWGRLVWTRYYRTLTPRPGLAAIATAQTAALDSLRRPGRMRALRRFARAGHAESGRRIERTKTPTLVIMGEADPDFADPGAEAAWIASATRGTSVMLPETGHYPQYERPDETADAIVAFLSDAGGRRA